MTRAGLTEFVRQLAARGIEIVSTGGTAKLLREAGITVRDVSDLTGWPEMLGGRVKTLHPKVHGGILFRRGEAGDRAQTAEHKIAPIDLVVVNLYPFEATAAKPDLTPEELIENIDIGGPTMVRSAAKNFESVAVVTDPADYAAVAAEITAHGEVSLATRLELARKAFALTARYDGKIATELERLSASSGSIELGQRPLLPERLHFAFTRRQELRYGENPHQRAALYVPAGSAATGLAAARQIARQGAFLQQSGGPRSGPRTRHGIPAARGRHRKAQQSMRHGGAGDAGGSLHEGPGLRSGFRVRRRDGVQSPARRRDRRGSGETFRRVHRRSGLRAGGARKICGQEKSAAAASSRMG